MLFHITLLFLSSVLSLQLFAFPKIKHINLFAELLFHCRKMNSQIYIVTEKMPKYGLKKGDLLCLDTLHYNHIEVYNKKSIGITALNLDGTKYFHADSVIGRKLFLR